MNNLNPRVDIVFKKLFGVEENKDLLMSLINSIVSEDDQVADIELLNPYNPRNFAKDKLSILDVKAKRKIDGQRYSIEIQLCDEGDYDKRALYYWGKLYTEQLEKGLDYSDLRKAIAIHILNFKSIVDNDSYHNKFNIRDEQDKKVYFEDLELHTIELNKFGSNIDKAKKNKGEATIDDFVSMIKTGLDRWTAFLAKYELLKQDRLPTALDTNELKKAIEIVDIMSFSDQERDEYEARLKWLRLETSVLNKKFQEGRAEGKLEGRAEGIKIGEERGEGKWRNKEKIEIAKNLLSLGLNISDIAKSTGLTVEEIAKLKKQKTKG